jgi:hypothetical protein
VSSRTIWRIDREKLVSFVYEEFTKKCFSEGLDPDKVWIKEMAPLTFTEREKVRVDAKETLDEVRKEKDGSKPG